MGQKTTYEEVDTMKSISQLQTVSDIKGMNSIGARSIPKAMRSSYLELYVLDRERARLEKEQFSTDKRRKNNQKRLDSLIVRMAKLKKEIDKKEGLKIHHSIPARKPFRTMSIKY
jgi:hypothetical protein